MSIAGVGLERLYNMAHALALGTRIWISGDVPGLELTNENVDLLRGEYVTLWSMV